MFMTASGDNTSVMKKVIKCGRLRQDQQDDAYILKKLGEDGRKAILEYFYNSPKKNGMITSEGNVVDDRYK